MKERLAIFKRKRLLQRETWGGGSVGITKERAVAAGLAETVGG